MKRLSLSKLAETVSSRRKAMKMSQAVLSEKTKINRSVISKLESAEFSPSVDQLLALAAVLGFETEAVLEGAEDGKSTAEAIKKANAKDAVAKLPRKRIAVAGTGYVGLSLAVLLSQHNDVTAVDIIPEKVEKINNWTSPIQDDYIEKFLAEHEERKLSLKATTDGAAVTCGTPMAVEPFVALAVVISSTIRSASFLEMR